MQYFTIEELTRSATASHLKIDNTPSERSRKHLERLVTCVLDPVREHWHSPIIVTSGYRSRELNRQVGGTEYSYHLKGMAADIYPQKGRLDALYELIRYLFVEGAIGITECYINEKKGYIHIAYDPQEFNAWPFIDNH